MALADNVSALIGDIYAGAHDMPVWDRAIDRLRDYTNSRFLLLSVVDLNRQEYCSTDWRMPDDARFLDGIRDYETDLYRADPTLHYGMQNPDAGFVSLSMAVAQSGIAYEDHPYVRWIRNVLGTGECAIRYTPAVDGILLGVSLHPSVARGSHSPEELALFFMIFEHIEGAKRLASLPPDFSSVREARLAIDHNGKVRAQSEAARQWLAHNDGLRLENGMLIAARATDTAKIMALLRSSLSALSEGGAGGSVRIPRPSGKRDWIVKISPLPPTASPFEAFLPAAHVHIIDPDAAPAAHNRDQWAKLFGLTPKEAELAEALLTRDENLRRTSEQIGMSYETARVHLAHIFQKTGVSSQAQLIRLLIRLDALG